MRDIWQSHKDSRWVHQSTENKGEVETKEPLVY